MTNTEHMELARLCAEWSNREAAAATVALGRDYAADGRLAALKQCRRELEAIINAATIIPDPKEEVVE